jgi:hypothetical protein
MFSKKPRKRILPGKRCPTCKGKGCSECKHRGFIIKAKKTKPPKKKHISKGHAINLEYGKLRKAFMLANPRCQFVSEAGVRCGEKATECHHRQGRGKFMLAVETWCALCSNHHNLVHSHPAMGKARGYLHSPITIRPLPPLPTEHDPNPSH